MPTFHRRAFILSATALGATAVWARAVAIVSTRMGHRGLRQADLAAVGEALRSRRAADRLLDTHQLAGLGVSREDVISSLQEQNAAGW